MFVSPTKFLKNFLNAARGIAYLFKSQKNARIQLSIAIIAVIAGIILRINQCEWLAVLLCIALVLGLEAINTAIETLADKVHPGFDTKIGIVKDVAAGAVLISSLLAFIIGFIIFAPRLWNLIEN